MCSLYLSRIDWRALLLLGFFDSFGLGLGLFTAFFGALVSPAYTTAAIFAVLIAVMVVRPGDLASGRGFAR